MKKISLLIPILIFIGIGHLKGVRYLSVATENPTIQFITKKLQQYSDVFQFENIYVQFDKPIYEPGETVWFSAFVRNAKDFKTAESEIVYVELLNPKGAVVTTRNLLIKNNAAAGDFHLGLDAVGGIYKIRAYTKWMQNVQQEVFEREITVQAVVLPMLLMELEFQRKAYGAGDKPLADLELKTLKNKPLSNFDFRYHVQFDGQTKTQLKGKTDKNGKATIQFDLPSDLETSDGLLNVMMDYEGQTESIAREIPIVLNHIDLQFLPESGELLANTWNNVAFKAVNEFGKAADIEGAIYNEDDEIVTYFSSYYLGMGKFELTPERNEKFYAKILSPKGIDKKYDLPKAKKAACVLKINEIQPNEIDLYIASNLKKSLYLLVENRGQVVYSEVLKPMTPKVFMKQKTKTTKIPTNINSQQIHIPTKDFPIGTSRITIVDKDKNALAQRLIFLNADKQLDISVKTDKELYLPREKIEAKITVKDYNGKPVQGNFAMSVADENLLTLADDKQGNILAQMLLQSELKGEIEAPNFYFETALTSDKIDRKKALDLLMMTQGWRRYEWQNIRKSAVATNQKKEKQVIAGRIIDNENVSNITVKIEGTNIQTKTDSQGNFEFKNVDLYEPKMLVFKNSSWSLEGIFIVNQYADNLKLYFYPNKGRIVDENAGEPLIGCNIHILNHKFGVHTDIDGYFNLDELLKYVEENRIKNPVFSVDYIGMESKTFTLDDLALVNSEVFQITLLEDFEVLDEIIVIGYGSRRPRLNLKRKEKAPRDKSRKTNSKPQQQPEGEKGKVKIDKFNKIYSESNDFVSSEWTGTAQTAYYYKPLSFEIAKFSPLKSKKRTDFRSTIYWNGNIQTDENGIAKVKFTNVDAITTYRITIEGFGQNGEIGFHKSNLVSSMPFSLRLKMPTQLTDGDVINLPITLVNNSDQKVNGKLKINLPNNLQLIEKINENQTLKANTAQTVFVKCKAIATGKVETLKVAFKSGEFDDAFEEEIKVENNGFPMNFTFAGAFENKKSYHFAINEPIENSANISLKLFPTVLNQVFNDLEKMMRMPSGCFEQTSSSNYPNVLALQYMREMGKTDLKVEAKAMGYLTKGYARLTSYESENGGFEWFGSDPGHEGLTAYGLMQFVDMSEVYPVSPILINRTAKWLMSRRDENGGWQMNERSLHSWAGSSQIYNAYVTWAVTEAGHAKKLPLELDKSYDDAVKTEDVYVMALAANALLNAKDKRGNELLEDILLRQKEDGSWDGLKHSIVYSTGKNLTIETTGLVMLAMMKNKNFGVQLRKANDFLMQQSSFGGYGNTQSTVLALKAIIEYAKIAKNIKDGGKAIVYLNDKKIGEYAYSEDEKDDIKLDNLVTDLPKGAYDLRVEFEKTKTPIPFEIEITYATTFPPTDEKAPIALNTKLLQTSINQGETVRYQIEIKNNNNLLRNNPIAIVGLPAGTSPQIWQLKKLQKEGVFDYYEMFNGYLVFYYRTLKSNEQKVINLDLKAETPGKYAAPASSAFLYYNSDKKSWAKAEVLEIL